MLTLLRRDKLRFLNKSHPKRMPVLPTTKEAWGLFLRTFVTERAHYWGSCLVGPCPGRFLLRPHLGVYSQVASCSQTQSQPPHGSVPVCPCCSSSQEKKLSTTSNSYLSTSSLPETGIQLLTFPRTRTSPLSWEPYGTC